MGILIDSGVLIDLERASKREAGAGLPKVEQLAAESGFLAAISVSELFHGVHRASTERIRSQREAFVNLCLEMLTILPFDQETAKLHSRIWSDLQRAGKVIGSHDLLIAATALEHGLPLLTGNVREFERVQDLRVIPWEWPVAPAGPQI